MRERRVVQSWRGRTEANETHHFATIHGSDGESFATPDIRRKPPEPLKQLNHKKEDSAVRLVSRASHDWRLMRHVTILEEDTHGRDCE